MRNKAFLFPVIWIGSTKDAKVRHDESKTIGNWIRCFGCIVLPTPTFWNTAARTITFPMRENMAADIPKQKSMKYCSSHTHFRLRDWRCQ